MSVVKCPRCRDEVTLPPRATGRSLVRCPLCLEQYLLAEALANSPPPLVIIGGDFAREAAVDGAEADEYRLAANAFAAPATDSLITPKASTAVVRPALSSSSRPRRKESSGLLLAANYIVGGVLGLSLGLLVLWWGFRRDPLELGPPIAAYAPWIVPATFRGNSVSNGNEPPPRERPHNGSSIAVTRDPDQPVRQRRRLKAAQPEKLQTLPGLDEPSTSTLQPLPPKIDDPPLSSPPASAEPQANQAKPPPAPDLTSLLPDDWPAIVEQPSEQLRFPSNRELTDATKIAAAALSSYEETPVVQAETRRQAFVGFHAAAGEVGRLLSYRRFDRSAMPYDAEDLPQLLDSVVGRGEILEGVERLTRQRWQDLTDGEGLLAAGKVQQFSSAGRRFGLSIVVGNNDGGQSMPVVFANDPHDLCSEGDKIVIAGRTVDNPKINLPGYDGEDPRVLAAGIAARVPAPQ